MSKEPRSKKTRIRRSLRTPEERCATDQDVVRIAAWSPLVALPALPLAALHPALILLPFALGIVLVAVGACEAEQFGRPKRRRRGAFRRFRLWLRGASIVHCPLCRDLVVAGEDALTTCGGCAVDYHAECRSELGGCATLGCLERAQRSRADSKLARLET